MAVLDIVAGLTAEIIINGDPAQEYDDDNKVEVQHNLRSVREYQASHTCSKYIESKSGQKFSMRMKVRHPLGHKKMAHARLTMEVEVDGILIWTLHCPRTWFKDKPDGAEWVSEDLVGPKDGKGRGCTTREVSFLKIQTSKSISTGYITELTYDDSGLRLI